ncbi:hypothetical protein NDA07_23105 [Microcoleus vaginatus DQ-U2]|uniref:hypothetical protein n=1 Tax=Microcoleus vaginatus TaxID=119532 RepID=UPI001688F2C6|nr:hypothetical protein [Microcoleus sp. FACHB-DQ6]
MNNFHRTRTPESPQLTIKQFNPGPRIHSWSEKKAPNPDRQPPDLSVGSLSSI